jgi:3'-phosphoadenosine 5'-phosphosulfate sulfotransferase (PAPS reductase)/FAD synthetase
MTRVFSYGGGVQSTAVLVLSAQGKLPYTHFVFANVGDDTENPKTLEYIEQFAKPYAENHGLFIIEIQKSSSTADNSTLYKELLSSNRSVAIPMYVNGVPIRRGCTSNWKVAVVEKFMRDYAGAKRKRKKPIGIGISLDEFKRMRTDNADRVTIMEYPLIDLRLTREDCVEIIKEANLPVPPKSSCWFCPYKKISEWKSLKEENPALFTKAIELEKKLTNLIYEDSTALLTNKKVPLENAVQDYEQKISKIKNYSESDDPENCESGYCMT